MATMPKDIHQKITSRFSKKQISRKNIDKILNCKIAINVYPGIAKHLLCMGNKYC